MDRLVRVVAHDGTATLYEYDVNGNRTAVRYANGIVVSYEYDEVNRLIREKVLDKNGAPVVEYSYTLGALTTTKNEQLLSLRSHVCSFFTLL